MTKLLLLSLSVPGMSMAVLVAAAAAEGAITMGSVILTAVVILLLVLLNGFFVTAEFSIIGVRPTQLEEMTDTRTSGQRKMVLSVLDSRVKQDRYIATAQLGITIASLGLAMYGEPQISHLIEPLIAGLWFEPSEALVRSLGYVIALSLMTYLHVVLGEMVPKSMALQNAPSLVLWIARPMQVAQTILVIPVRLLNAVGSWLLRVFKVPPAEGHARVLSPEEIELLVTESAEGGLLNEDEEEMIRNIFDFSDRLAGQVMSPRTRVQAIPVDIAKNELLQIVTESRHSRFPVYENDLDHITGIVHLKDLIRQTMRPDSRFDIRLIMRSAPAVPEDYPVEKLLAAFKSQRLHMAIVLDEFGGMAGIVTLEDLVEEIVGEVRDEFDLEREPFVVLEPGVIEAAGDYLVDDLAEMVYLGEREGLPDVETIGGLVVAKLGRPPEINDEVIYDEQVSFRVLDIDRLAVTRVRIEFPDQAVIKPEPSSPDHDKA
ncbi:MAG: HlyC/CorC family transporter [Ardenticatenaceae bacterium]|nr:HlyC/CorC family transporter [Ardenticatenaceae bacterium]MCB8986303.1 HlyC/CorC family transporter [Ardenticatenaceae bacterium]